MLREQAIFAQNVGLSLSLKEKQSQACQPPVSALATVQKVNFAGRGIAAAADPILPIKSQHVHLFLPDFPLPISET